MAQRTGNRGFVLWDALIAFAIVSVAVTAIVVTLPQFSLRSADRVRRHEATEFAFSKIEEYRVTFPNMQAQGADPSGWSWSIVDRAVHEPASAAPLQFVEIEVTTWHASRPDLRATLTAVIARRSPR